MLKGLHSRWRVEFWLVFAGILLMLILRIVQQLLLNEPGAANYVHILGAPLDDVYIHCQYAKNLLNGKGFSFFSGVQLTADTSPLWIMLLAATEGILSMIGLSIRFDTVAIGLSILFYLMLALGVYRASRDVFHLNERWSRVAGIVTVLGSRMIWSAASGMEVTLAALIMLLVVEEHERAKQSGGMRFREAVFLGLGYNVRPEFLFLIALVYLDWIYYYVKRHQRLTRPLLAALLTAVLLLPYPIFSYLTSGSFVSHSSLVQGARISFIPNFKYLWFALRIYASNNLMAFALLAVGAVMLIRDPKWRLAILLCIGLPILQAFVAPQFRHSGRYFFPVFPVVMILACAMAERVSVRYASRKMLGMSMIVLLLLGGSVEAARWIYIESCSVRNINDQQLAIPSWITSHRAPTDRFAVDDVGALEFFTDARLIDLTGLMTPKLFPMQHDQDSVWSEARAEGATIFIIFNRLNPPFYEHHKDSLVLMKEFSVRLPLASSADTTMSIYRVKGTAHAAD